MKKVILAYSGGLDTSVILKWLLDKGFDVLCFVADLGQKEDFDSLEKNALSLGASRVCIKDLKEEFLKNYIFQALKANAKYEGRYLLGTALARPLIGKELARIAKEEGVLNIAHGATGKGNDQVRFELAIYQQLKEAKIIAPWREPTFYERFQGRKDLIEYAQKHKIPIKSTLEKPYSKDENLMHVSYEGGILEDPARSPSDEMFTLTISPQQAKDQVTNIVITFENGIPILLELKEIEKTISNPLDIFQTLNKLAGENAIGRLDIVESRIVGIKSRGVYESPAATLLWTAHADLESLTLDGEVLKIKHQLEHTISDLIYQGLWFTPEMDFLMKAIEESQRSVNGKVYLSLYKGSCWVTGRESGNALYDEALSSMNELGGYDQKDATGFIKIRSLRLRKGNVV